MTFALLTDDIQFGAGWALAKSYETARSKTRIPKNATLVAGSMAAIAGGVFPLAEYRFLLKYLYLGLPGYVGLCPLEIAARNTGLPGPGEFKTPLVPVLPILSIVVCLSFMT